MQPYAHPAAQRGSGAWEQCCTSVVLKQPVSCSVNITCGLLGGCLLQSWCKCMQEVEVLWRERRAPGHLFVVLRSGAWSQDLSYILQNALPAMGAGTTAPSSLVSKPCRLCYLHAPSKAMPVSLGQCHSMNKKASFPSPHVSAVYGL